ncbi:testis-specific serine/threonine-protein kinase 4-like [Mycteria americana]|uniref:testis-specific serine/threonine-protein kinase 4-like n=1 Tax=Mycteria americana TaxID=33587 RepID=UPI003F58C0C5
MERRTGFYLLMELAPSGSVLEWVQSQGPCSQGQAGLWFSQLLLALAYLHSRAIVHWWGLEAGKPSPGQQGQGEGLHLQLLQDSGPAGCQWVLGASRHARLPAKAALSQAFCGSYAYACPEILQAQPYDPFPADTWSAGVTLYALLLAACPGMPPTCGASCMRPSGPLPSPKGSCCPEGRR